jgi:hypothetical protein
VGTTHQITIILGSKAKQFDASEKRRKIIATQRYDEPILSEKSEIRTSK